MRLVPRVTSVTVVAVLALTLTLVGPPAGASPSYDGQRAAAAGHRLTPQQRYERRHPHLAKALRIAMRQRGDRYKYGAEGPDRFDCSGLVQYAFRHAGFRNVPRTSRQQYRWATRIRHRQLRPGDLMFFHHGRRVYHVAIFQSWSHGRRLMLHAPSPGRRVQRDHPWTRHYWAATLRR